MDDSFLAMSDCQQRAHTLSCALCKTSTAGGKTVYRGFDFTFCSSQCRNLVAMSNRDPQEAIKNMTAGRALDIPSSASRAQSRQAAVETMRNLSFHEVEPENRKNVSFDSSSQGGAVI